MTEWQCSRLGNAASFSASSDESETHERDLQTLLGTYSIQVSVKR